MSDEGAADTLAAARLESGEAWRSLCRTLEATGERVLGEGVPDDPRLRAEGFRYLTRFLQAGLVSCVAHDDPDQPVFARMMDYTMPWGLDNPDCLYLYAPLRGDAVYRVHGTRGSANHIDIQVNFGHFANGDIASWGTLGSLSGDELEIDADGGFALVIGGDPRPGNWIASAPNAEFLLVRQYFDDWEAERPADLLIDRVGAPLPAPPPTGRGIDGQLRKLERWLDRGGRLWEAMSRGFLSTPPNTLQIHMPGPAAERSGMRGQAYGIGHFRCEPDEAVILEFEPPACRHWGVALANYYWECVEFGTRQSSLNRSQAVLCADGTFRAVIAHRDPGVANWLDPGCNVDGTLTARFLLAESAPTPRMRVVGFDALDAALPDDTPRLDAAARADVLARRRLAVLRRYRR